MVDNDPFADLPNAGGGDDPFADLPSINNAPAQQAAQSQSQPQGNAFVDALKRAGAFALETGRKSAIDNQRFMPKLLNAIYPGMGSAVNAAQTDRTQFSNLPSGYRTAGITPSFAEDIGTNLGGFLIGPGGVATKATNKILPKTMNSLSRSVLSGAGGAGGHAIATSGQENAGEELQNIGIQTGLGGLFGALGHGAGAAAGYAGKKYAQSAIPGFIERASEKLKNVVNPNKAAQELKSSYEKAAGLSKEKWGNTESLARSLDEQLPKVTKQEQVSSGIMDAYGNPIMKVKEVQQSGFDNKPYTDFMNKKIGEIKKMSPNEKAQYQDVLDVAKQLKTKAPTGFNDLVLMRQNLNQTVKKILESKGITKQDVNVNNFIKEIKDTVSNNVLNKNAANLPKDKIDAFKKSWDEANKSTIRLQDYYKGQQSQGRVATLKVLGEGYRNGTLSDMALLQRYIPANAKAGIGAMKELEKIVGSKAKVQEMAKSYLFNDLFKSGNKKTDASDIYSKLSPEAREYIFGKEGAENLLETVNKTRLKFGYEVPQDMMQKVGSFMGHYGAPALLGAGAAHYSGANPLISLGLGTAAALTSKVGRAAIGKYASPESVNKALNLYDKGGKTGGKYLNIYPFIDRQNERNAK